MALKKEDITTLAILAKIPVADLEKAIAEKDEVALTIQDKLSVFTEEEVTTLKKNEYNSGKTAGVEIAVKESREKLGLNFTGKTIDGLVEAATKKALEDAKVEPDKKVTELQEKVTTLQNTVKEYETKMAEKDNEVEGIRTSGELYKHIPSPGENGPAMSQDEIIQLMKINGYDFKREEGKLVPYKDGKKLTDKLGEPLPVGDVTTGFMKEKKIITEEVVPGGRGTGDRKPGAKATKMSELKEQFTSQGKNLQGEEFNKAVQQAVAENKDFDLNS
jgi:hypothetical protein